MRSFTTSILTYPTVTCLRLEPMSNGMMLMSEGWTAQRMMNGGVGHENTSLCPYTACRSPSSRGTNELRDPNLQLISTLKMYEYCRTHWKNGRYNELNPCESRLLFSIDSGTLEIFRLGVIGIAQDLTGFKARACGVQCAQLLLPTKKAGLVVMSPDPHRCEDRLLL